MMGRKFKKKKKAIILLSGGIDSVTTLYYALNKGYEIYGLLFDYGQRHKKELNMAQQILNNLNIEYKCLRIKLSWSKSSLTDTHKELPFYKKNKKIKNLPSTYVPGRNIIFLSYAASWADSLGADCIFIGAHTQDYSGYPDCRPKFIDSMQDALRNGLSNNKISIKAPLLYKDKKEIIQLGIKLKVPFQLTWSCYNGGKYPCGKCDSCYFRNKAFKELGLVDPLVLKYRNKL